MKLTFEQAKIEIQTMDPNLKRDDEVFKVAVLMILGSINEKFSVSLLEEATGYDRVLVKRTVRNLKSEGIWRQATIDNKMTWRVYHSGWFDEDGGGVAFWLDVNRAMGFITAKH